MYHKNNSTFTVATTWHVVVISQDIFYFYTSLRQSQGRVLIIKISYNCCDITGLYSMTAFTFIVFVIIIDKHTTNRCKFKV